MNKISAFAVLALGLLVPAHALDLKYSLAAGSGIGMAFGSSQDSGADAFSVSAGSDTVSAPVLGAVFSLGADIGFLGAFRALAGLEARRLGYAYWSSDTGSSTWLTLWTAALRLGVRYYPGSWYVGAGGFAAAPVSPIVQGSNQGESGIKIVYDVTIGKVFVPGAYLEGGISLGPRWTIGPVAVLPRLGLEAGCWPGGILDSGTSWQTAFSLVASFGIERRSIK